MTPEWWLKELASPLAELAIVLAGDEYNEEDEKQAILRFNRRISDAIARRDLAESATDPFPKP